MMCPQNLSFLHHFHHSQKLSFLKNRNEFFEWFRMARIYFSLVQPVSSHDPDLHKANWAHHFVRNWKICPP